MLNFKCHRIFFPSNSPELHRLQRQAICYFHRSHRRARVQADKVPTWELRSRGSSGKELVAAAGCDIRYITPSNNRCGKSVAHQRVNPA